MTAKPKTYGGRWKILESLDAGGQADVFLVEDLTAEYPKSVLKRIRNATRTNRFAAEAEACKRLTHPHIVELRDAYGLTDGTPLVGGALFLVFALAEGGSLAKRPALYKGALDTTLLVATDLAEALGYAHHNGVIHRDVKPANILFKGVDHHSLLSDFGICLIRDMPSDTPSAEWVGPRCYMAPELEGDPGNTSPSVDIYSLGKVIYYMLSGGTDLPRERHREPDFDLFSGGGPRYTMLGRLLDDMICLAPRRLSSMSEIVDRLGQITQWERSIQESPLSAGSVAAIERFGEGKRGEAEIERLNRDDRNRAKAELKNFGDACLPWLEEKLASVARAMEAHIGDVTVGRLSEHDLENTSWPLVGRRMFFVGAGALRVRADSQDHVLAFIVCAPTRNYRRDERPPRRIDYVPYDVLFVPLWYKRNGWSVFLFKEGDGKFACRRQTGRGLIEFKGPVTDWPGAVTGFEGVIDAAISAFITGLEDRVYNRHGN